MAKVILTLLFDGIKNSHLLIHRDRIKLQLDCLISSCPVSFSHTNPSISQFHTAQSVQRQKEIGGRVNKTDTEAERQTQTRHYKTLKHTQNSPSPWQEVDLDKRVRIAVIVPWG